MVEEQRERYLRAGFLLTAAQLIAKDHGEVELIASIELARNAIEDALAQVDNGHRERNSSARN